ncbi:MAG: 50S ribosomal protein L3 [Patescibacteria group bacterium]
MKYLLGKKMHMGQLFKEDGLVVPVTYVHVLPCTVAAIKKDEQGHAIALLGTGEHKNLNRAQAKQFAEVGSFARTEQVRIEEGSVEVGTVFTAAVFALGELVNVFGITKGKGFQGVVKRHGFRGHPTTHGHKDQVRKSGSIGAGGIQRVFKGMRMAGRMGGDQVTVKNLEVIAVDVENNFIAVKGALPGARGTQVTLMGTDGNVWRK